MSQIDQLIADQATEITDFGTEFTALIDAVNAKVADLTSQIQALQGTVASPDAIATLTANSQAIADDLQKAKDAVATLTPAPTPTPEPTPTP